MASPGNQHCANCIGTLSFRLMSSSGSLAKAVAFYSGRIHKCVDLTRDHSALLYIQLYIG